MHEFDGEGVSGWSCDDCGWSFDNEDEDDTSTEAHMSKRVEVRVKAGDKWGVIGGTLVQIRQSAHRLVASTGVLLCEWRPTGDDDIHQIDEAVARFWIWRFGGEWAEVAEEKKVQAAKVVYYADCDGEIVTVIEGGECDKRLADLATFSRITIAGVT
jgi:hypothetical protein